MHDIKVWVRECLRSVKALPLLARRLRNMDAQIHEHTEHVARLEAKAAERLAWLESVAVEHNGRFDRHDERFARTEAALAQAAERLGHPETITNEMRDELARFAPLLRLIPTEPLPFAWMAPAPCWVERASERVGRPLAALSLEERKDAFYSYYSEMGGDHGSILRQQYQAYLPMLQKAARGGGRVLDIGCGAGEFLSFLRDEQLGGLGVDLAASEVRRATAAGLAAICENAVNFVAGTDERFAGITMFQVIEHLAPDDVLPTLEACVNRLMPGGVLMVETINMRHPMAVNGFYTDPTHRKPLSDNYLGFLLQWLGLHDVGVLYTLPEPLPGVSTDDPPRLYANYTVFGFASGAV